MIGDSNRRVWVRQYRVDPDADTEWRILDGSGDEIGALQLPGRFELHAVDGRYLLGVWRDELDVEYVQVWSFSR